jgi:hypothetical protein
MDMSIKKGKPIMKPLLPLLVGLSSLVLTGCFEVEDSSNDDEVAAINEQTAAIIEQNTLLQQQIDNDVASVTAYGLVIDSVTLEPIQNGTITASYGSVSLASITITDGRFEIENLPGGTDIELFIQAGEQYLNQPVYTKTNDSSTGTSSQDLGTLFISPRQQFSFQVLNEENGEVLSEYVFSYSNATYQDRTQNESSLAWDRRIVSTFSETLDAYVIDTPSGGSFSLRADIDLDNDGQADFASTDSGRILNTFLYLDSLRFNADNQITLSQPEADPQTSPIEIRVTVLGENYEAVDGLELELSGSENGVRNFSYDEMTMQYVTNAVLGANADVLIPAFTHNDIDFLSSSISIDLRSSLSERSINFVGERDFQNTYSLPANQATVDLVIAPREGTSFVSTDLEVVLDTLDLNSSRYRVFYSNSIGLLENSVSLIQENAVSVTRGNQSDSDLVPNGTTEITIGELEREVTSELSLNNTVLTLQPSSSLQSGTYYRYNIGVLIDETSNVPVDLNDNSDRFFAEPGNAFDINEVVADNENYTNRGTAIVATNTAGVASSSQDTDRSVYVYLPLSIRSLENLLFTVSEINEAGAIRNSSTVFTIVQDGNPFNSSLIHTVSLAENENIRNTGFSSIESGTSLPDGIYYRLRISEFMSDHTDTEINTVSLDYFYNVPGGDVQTGTLTLEVQ